MQMEWLFQINAVRLRVDFIHPSKTDSWSQRLEELATTMQWSGLPLEHNNVCRDYSGNFYSFLPTAIAIFQQQAYDVARGLSGDLSEQVWTHRDRLTDRCSNSIWVAVHDVLWPQLTGTATLRGFGFFIIVSLRKQTVMVSRKIKCRRLSIRYKSLENFLFSFLKLGLFKFCSSCLKFWSISFDFCSKNEKKYSTVHIKTV